MALGSNNNITGNVGGVSKYVDTAYDNIKKVADNLEKLLTLEQAFSSLNGISLGTLTSPPTQRPDTSPLQDGDHYLNSTNNLFYVYFEGAWIFHAIFYTQTGLQDAVGKGPFHTWIAYAESSIGSVISTNPVNKDYIGFVLGQDTSVIDISDPSIFTWSLIKGDAAYIHIAYADSIDGSVNFNTSSGAYLGQYTDNTATASNDPSLYNWVLIRGSGTSGSNGNDGQQGPTGSQGIPGIDATILVEPPTIPTGISFTTNDFSSKISWDIPNYSGHDFVRIYRASWDGTNLIPFDSNFEIKEARGTEFLDYGLSSQQNYLYWLRNVNIEGAESGLAPSIAGAQILTTIGLKDTPGWITALNLETILNTRIDLIDTTLTDGESGIIGAYNALKINNTALNLAHDVLNTTVGTTSSGLLQAHNLLQSDHDLLSVIIGDVNSGLIQDFGLLDASININTSTINGLSNSVITLTGVSDANALAITSLQSQLNSSNVNLMRNYNFEGSFTDHITGGTISSAEFKAGANSLQINSGVQFDDIWKQHSSNSFPVYTEGQTYTIGFWAKNTDTVQRQFGYPGATPYGIIDIPVDNNWVWFSTSFTVPVGFVTNTDIDGDYWPYELRTNAVWVGSVFIDEVVILRGTHVLDGTEVFITNEAAFASASAIDSLQTSVTNLDGITTAHAIQILALEATDSGHTSSITNLNSVTGVNATAISTVQTDLNIVEIQAQTSEDNAAFTMKVQANGNVAGIGLIATDAATAIVFSADLIGISNGIGGSVLPFTVSNNIVYMENARIKLLEASVISNVGFVPGEVAVAGLGNVNIAGSLNIVEPGQIKWKDLDPAFSQLLSVRQGIASGGNRTLSTTTFVPGNTLYAAQNGTGTPNNPLLASGLLLTIDVFFFGGVSIAEGYTAALISPTVNYTVRKRNINTGIITVIDTAIATGVSATEFGFTTTKIDYVKTSVPVVNTENDAYEYWVEINSKSGHWGPTVIDASTKGYFTLAINETPSNLEDVIVSELLVKNTTTPTIIIQDTDSTGSTMTGGLNFRDSQNNTQAILGWLNNSSTDLLLLNELGDILLQGKVGGQNTVLNLGTTLSYAPPGAGTVDVLHEGNFLTNNIIGNTVIPDGYVMTWNNTQNYWAAEAIPTQPVGSHSHNAITSVDESIDSICYPAFFNNATGNQAIKTGTNLTFNSASGRLSAVQFNVTSDLTLKNVLPFKLPAHHIDTILFDFKDGVSGVNQYGYAAQQVFLSMPQAVGDDGENLTVNYTMVHTVKIAKLERQVQQLKKTLDNVILQK